MAFFADVFLWENLTEEVTGILTAVYVVYDVSPLTGPGISSCVFVFCVAYKALAGIKSGGTKENKKRSESANLHGA